MVGFGKRNLKNSSQWFGKLLKFTIQIFDLDSEMIYLVLCLFFCMKPSPSRASVVDRRQRLLTGVAWHAAQSVDWGAAGHLGQCRTDAAVDFVLGCIFGRTNMNKCGSGNMAQRNVWISQSCDARTVLYRKGKFLFCKSCKYRLCYESVQVKQLLSAKKINQWFSERHFWGRPGAVILWWHWDPERLRWIKSCSLQTFNRVKKLKESFNHLRISSIGPLDFGFMEQSEIDLSFPLATAAKEKKRARRN